jgi:Cd2+/Zn2+-exporting ATPase
MIGRFSQLGVYHELLTLRDFYISAGAGLLALASYILDQDAASPSMYGNLLALTAVALNGLPIIWGALKGLIHKQVNVDELVSLAIIASLIQGEFLTAAVVSFVMTLGALVEEVTSDSARKAIRALMAITPKTATILEDGGEREAPIEQVKVGDRVLVKPGQSIPVDAVILKGVAAVDESSMTGEPLPKEKHPGDTVLAGSLNHTGVLEIQAKRVGKDSTLGKVIDLVSRAEAHRPKPSAS